VFLVFLAAAFLQRILFNAREIGRGVLCGQIGTSSLRKDEVFHARLAHLPQEAVVLSMQRGP